MPWPRARRSKLGMTNTAANTNKQDIELEEALAADGRFELVDQLGAGAMGVVYRARDATRRQDVALKLLSRVDPDTLYQFKNEFRALSDLVHPNLVTLYGLHHLDDRWVLSMELVRGAKSLLDFIRPYSHLLQPRSSSGGHTGSSSSSVTSKLTPQVLEAAMATQTQSLAVAQLASAGPMVTPPGATSTSTAASTASLAESVLTPSQEKRQAIASAELMMGRLETSLGQLLDGVEALHRVGMLHRDLKPSNVLVDEVGRLVVCDFGLAAPTGAGAAHFAGTPAYSSPEQAEGLALSPASDWYSVGVMLYEMLTGVLPVQGPSAAEILRAKRNATVTDPRELAPDVDQRLAALAMDLLAPDPESRPSAEQIRERVGATRSTVPVTLGRDNALFVGRGAECAELDRALQDARSGTAVTVIVKGESGVGKSALIRHVTSQWVEDKDALILSGRCYENELVAFKALDGVVDSLAEALLELSDDRARELLDGNVAALATLFPVLRRVKAVAALMAALPASSAGQEVRGDAARGLRHLLAGLSKQRPTIVIIDDLQWGDMDSSVFLQELAEGSDDAGLLLLATYRSVSEVAPPLVKALADPDQAVTARDVRVLELAPLPQDEAVELVRAVAGPGADASTVLADAGGSPLFLAELAHAWARGDDLVSDGGLDGLIARRLDSLDRSTRRLLEVAALSGRPRPSAILASAAGAKDEAAAVATLRTGRFVRVEHSRDGELLAPYHDRIRETALSQLDPKTRRKLHRRLARSLESAPNRDVEGLVEHWLAAGDRGKAGRYALEAAERASVAQAHRRAAEHLTTVLELCELDEAGQRRFSIARADALAAAGSVRAAADAYRQAAALCDDADAAELLGRAMVCLVHGSCLVEADELARELNQRVGFRIPSSVGRAIAQLLWQRLRLRLRGTRLHRVRDESEIEPRELRGLTIARDVSSALGLTDTIPGFAVHSWYFRKALTHGLPRHVLQAMCLEASFIVGLKGMLARKRADRLFDGAEALALEHGTEADHGLVRGWRAFAGYLYYDDTRNNGAELEAAAEITDTDVSLSWHANLFRLYSVNGLALGGEIADLKRRLPALLRRAQERGNEYLMANYGRQAGSYVWLSLDRADEAMRLLESSTPPETRQPTLDSFYSEVIAAEVELYAGNAHAAQQRVEQFLVTMKGSSMARIPSVVLWSAQAVAKAAVAASYQRPEHKDEHLAVARRWARWLRRRRRTFPVFANGLANLVEGLVALRQGQREAAIDALRVANRDLIVGTPLWAWPTRDVLGRLVGGTEGAELRAEAGAWLERQEVANPDRFVRWACPHNE